MKQLGVLAAASFQARARDVGNKISAERALPAACAAIESAIQSA